MLRSDDLGDRRTYAIIGAAMEVHGTLGRGLLEEHYRQALAIELGLRKIPFEREVGCPVSYKGVRLGGTARMDFVCFDAVVVEVKARAIVGPAERAQLLNYLSSSGLLCGLLLNFGTPRLDYHRLIGPSVSRLP
ncbi:MAG: GxxExxY protein [Vicinamibacterales bacterium]